MEVWSIGLWFQVSGVRGQITDVRGQKTADKHLNSDFEFLSSISQIF